MKVIRRSFYNDYWTTELSDSLLTLNDDFVLCRDMRQVEWCRLTVGVGGVGASPVRGEQ